MKSRAIFILNTTILFHNSFLLWIFKKNSDSCPECQKKSSSLSSMEARATGRCCDSGHIETHPKEFFTWCRKFNPNASCVSCAPCTGLRLSTFFLQHFGRVILFTIEEYNDGHLADLALIRAVLVHMVAAALAAIPGVKRCNRKCPVYSSQNFCRLVQPE